MRRGHVVYKTSITLADIDDIDTFTPSSANLRSGRNEGLDHVGVRVLVRLTTSKRSKPVWRVVYVSTDNRLYILSNSLKLYLDASTIREVEAYRFDK